MIIFHKKKMMATLVVVGIVAFGSLSFSQAPKPHKEGPRNLKVLPKNISHDELIAIMHDFTHALNYHCEDCHAASPANPKELDFASDANPKKEVARHMIKMMMRINKKYFNVKGNFATNYLDAKYDVTCYTCHHGSEHPLTFPDMKKIENAVMQNQ